MQSSDDEERAINRAGLLSRRQKVYLSLEGLGAIISIVTFLAGLLALVWFTPAPYGPLWLIGVFPIVLAAYETVRLWLDIIQDELISIRGEFRKSRERLPRSPYRYFLTQKGIKLEISEKQYTTFDESSVYQVFYLPRTKKAISICKLYE
jgi:hypothetical protein